MTSSLDTNNKKYIDFEQKLKRFLKNRKAISPTDRSGIYIRNVADSLKETQQFASVLQLIITFIGIGTLIAGIIGISNIMVFVVKERTKELDQQRFSERVKGRFG